MTTLIPKDFHRAACTEDQYKKVTVTSYYNGTNGKCIMVISDLIEETEKSIGPFELKHLEVIKNVIDDMLWKARKG
jgi:hypothetical protein